MITETHIEELIKEKLEGSDKFLVSLKIKPGNKILVFIDGDTYVTIDDCVKLSRHIESSLDRDTEDFELQVSSSGADQALKFIRQYNKHIGRNFIIMTEDGDQIKGNLESTDGDGIKLKIQADKKKKTQEQIRYFPLSNIRESKIELSFKK